ncbi:MAG: hypothetical protein JXJ17_04405 [Anaerolineae bacterium]|nr:hypothetical protein [Anaerolineae bacterium]
MNIVKVRIMGKKEQIDRVVEKISKVVEVAEQSGHYANRGDDQTFRVYLTILEK